MYGNIESYRDRIINTFKDRKDSTGVLLLGPKGTGKTLLTRCIAQTLFEQELPVIIVPFSLVCQGVTDFISTIDTECVVIFDEIDKISTNDDNEPDSDCLLSLLDGVAAFKRLYLFTANVSWKINEYMMSRPGRIYYKIEFDGLSQEAVEDYCKEHLKEQKYLKDVVSISGYVSKFSFDMLSALVEEVNRYGETPKEACKLLNIDPCFSGSYEVHVFNRSGKELRVDRENKYKFFKTDSLDDQLYIRYYAKDSTSAVTTVMIYPAEVTRVENRTLVYENLTGGVTVKLIPCTTDLMF